MCGHIITWQRLTKDLPVVLAQWSNKLAERFSADDQLLCACGKYREGQSSTRLHHVASKHSVLLPSTYPMVSQSHQDHPFKSPICGIPSSKSRHVVYPTQQDGETWDSLRRPQIIEINTDSGNVAVNKEQGKIMVRESFRHLIKR